MQAMQTVRSTARPAAPASPESHFGSGSTNPAAGLSRRPARARRTALQSPRGVHDFLLKGTILQAGDVSRAGACVHARFFDRAPDAGTLSLHSVALEYFLATLAQLRAVLLQTLLNRVVVAQLLPAKSLCVSQLPVQAVDRGSARKGLPEAAHYHRRAECGNAGARQQVRRASDVQSGRIHRQDRCYQARSAAIGVRAIRIREHARGCTRDCGFQSRILADAVQNVWWGRAA